MPGPTASEPTGKIGIELPSGIKLSVDAMGDAMIDAEALARVQSVVSR